jgi:hypothetical protein
VRHRDEPAVARHVDAVVVARAQVERCKVAVLERCGERRIAAEERRRRVTMALGLENLVAVDSAELADRAVDRADQIGRRDRPPARAQRAREEVVEGCVVRRIGLRGFFHVDAVAPDEPANQRRRQRAAACAGNPAREPCEARFGHEVLRQDGERIGHEGRVSRGARILSSGRL